MHGLRPDLRHFVISRVPTSIDQAINMARLAESLSGLTAPTPQSTPVVHQVATPETPDMDNLLPPGGGPGTPVSQGISPGPVPSQECQFCKRAGHKRENCFKRLRAEGIVATRDRQGSSSSPHYHNQQPRQSGPPPSWHKTCFSCGSPHHLAHSCPQANGPAGPSQGFRSSEN
jgi:hypothetical protein